MYLCLPMSAGHVLTTANPVPVLEDWLSHLQGLVYETTVLFVYSFTIPDVRVPLPPPLLEAGGAWVVDAEDGVAEDGVASFILRVSSSAVGDSGGGT